MTPHRVVSRSVMVRQRIRHANWPLPKLQNARCTDFIHWDNFLPSASEKNNRGCREVCDESKAEEEGEGEDVLMLARPHRVQAVLHSLGVIQQRELGLGHGLGGGGQNNLFSVRCPRHFPASVISEIISVSRCHELSVTNVTLTRGPSPGMQTMLQTQGDKDISNNHTTAHILAGKRSCKEKTVLFSRVLN